LIVEALDLLRSHSGFTQWKCSRLFETPPIGGPTGQSVFLNGVAIAETLYTAKQILEILQFTELALGRVRKDRWGSRTIDLDLVLYGDSVGSNDECQLTIPHPRYVVRTFVLRPAMDVAPSWVDPLSGWTIQELSCHLAVAPPSMAIVGSNRETREKICAGVASAGVIVVRQVCAQEPVPFALAHATNFRSYDNQTESHESIPSDRPWVSDFVPKLSVADAALGESRTRLSAATTSPRVIARLKQVSRLQPWPEPRRFWRNGWNWPEFRLESDCVDGAVIEVLTALEAMQCPVEPISDSRDWQEL
jgi:2-amino-4-hydroxy-6-hydroxymethyldihydropteridine diphosphokinase